MKVFIKILSAVSLFFLNLLMFCVTFIGHFSSKICMTFSMLSIICAGLAWMEQDKMTVPFLGIALGFFSVQLLGRALYQKGIGFAGKISNFLKTR